MDDYLGEPYCLHQHGIVVPKEFSNYFKFSSVRLPYERIVSQWHFSTTRMGKTFSFEEYLEFLQPTVPDKLFESYNGWEFATYSQLERLTVGKFDYILKYENLKSDFEKLPFVKESTIQEARYPGNYDDWQNTNESKDLIYKWAFEDFKKYKYEKH